MNKCIKLHDNSDNSELFQLLTPSIMKWLPYDLYNKYSEFVQFYEQLSLKCELYTVSDVKSGDKCGILTINHIDNYHKKCEIGHVWLAEEYQGKGIMRRAVFEVLSECFNARNYKRVAWKCDENNQKSYSFAIKNGFKKEGVFRNYETVKGKNKNAVYFAIIAEEWKKIKEDFYYDYSTAPQLFS
jgi:RimJ/RimL family protein N-acetyltransferase